jgi:hypothetical protein
MRSSGFFFVLGWIMILADGWLWHTYFLAIMGCISLIGSFHLINLENKDD